MAIVALLKDQKIKFLTYPMEKEEGLRVVIKGVLENTTPAEVRGATTSRIPPRENLQKAVIQDRQPRQALLINKYWPCTILTPLLMHCYLCQYF